MATGYLLPISTILQFFTDQGVVLAGGKVYTYVAGTTTPVATYTSSSLSVAQANPIILQSNGRLGSPVWVPAGVTVKMVLQDSSGNTISGGTIDNLEGINDPSYLTANGIGLALYPQTAAELAASVTPSSYQYPAGNVLRYGATGNGSTDDTTAINKALSCNTYVTFPLGTYVTSSALNVLNGTYIQGQSVGGADSYLSGNAPVTILSSAAYGISCNPTGSEAWLGIEISNLMVRSSTGTGTGIFINNINHCVFRNVNTADYSSGIGWQFGINSTFFAGQYSTLFECRSFNCQSGLVNNSYGGLEIIGGIFDGNNNGTPSTSPTVGATGITVNAADNCLLLGTRIQGFATAINVTANAYYFKAVGTRHEMFTTGMLINGNFSVIDSSNSFNNYIDGSGGACVVIGATANSTLVQKFNYGSVSPVPVTNGGTNTIREDALTFRLLLPTLTTTITIPIGVVPPGYSVLPSNIKFVNGGSTLSTLYANRWQFQITGWGSYIDTSMTGTGYTAGWPSGTVQTFLGEATGSTGTAQTPGNILYMTFTANGSAPNITDSYIEVTYVRY
jgi:Pectate lyase superfamily protein